MCLVLLYLGDEDAGDDQQVILAANRDEFYSRPTTPSTYYFDPDEAFRKSFETETPVSSGNPLYESVVQLPKTSTHDRKKPLVMLGPRDQKAGDDERPLLGSPFLVGSGKRWAVITNNYESPITATIPKSGFAFILRMGVQLGLRGRMIILLGTALMFVACHFLKIDQCHHGVFCVMTLYIIFAAASWLLKRTMLRTVGFNGHKARGQLLASFVNSKLRPEEFVDQLVARDDMKFDGFSLMIGIGNDGYFVSNRPPKEGPVDLTSHGFYKVKLKKGEIYCVSNAFLNDTRGKVDYARRLFSPIVQKLGCRAEKPDCEVSISKEERDLAVRELICSVMGNQNKREVIPTLRIPDIDEKLARIFVVPFEMMNPVTKRLDVMGTRDTIVMTMNFEDASANDSDSDGIGFSGVSLWDMDHCSKSNPSSDMLVFDEQTHRDAATRYKRYLFTRKEGPRYNSIEAKKR